MPTPQTLKISPAAFDRLIVAARMLDETMPALRQEEITRRIWVKGDDGWFYYVSPVERMEAVLQ